MQTALFFFLEFGYSAVPYVGGSAGQVPSRHSLGNSLAVPNSSIAAPPSGPNVS